MYCLLTCGRFSEENGVNGRICQSAIRGMGGVQTQNWLFWDLETLQVLGRPILRQNPDWLKTQKGNIYG